MVGVVTWCRVVSRSELGVAFSPSVFVESGITEGVTLVATSHDSSFALSLLQSRAERRLLVTDCCLCLWRVYAYLLPSRRCWGDWLWRLKDLFERQQSPDGDGYNFVGSLLVRTCNEMTNPGLGLVKQEIYPSVLTGLAMTEQQETAVHIFTHSGTNDWPLTVIY
jgi:hypothetical protein